MMIQEREGLWVRGEEPVTMERVVEEVERMRNPGRTQKRQRQGQGARRRKERRYLGGRGDLHICLINMY